MNDFEIVRLARANREKLINGLHKAFVRHYGMHWLDSPETYAGFLECVIYNEHYRKSKDRLESSASEPPFADWNL